MKSLLNIFKSTAGFTLIELLVVIGILGILASALVATIDPFEQLNKAQDSNLKNATVEFLNANVRYFTTHNAMPWDSTGAGCNSAALPAGTAVSAMADCTTALIDEGELKQGFATYNGLSKIFVTADSNNNVVGCFEPSSKSQQKDALTIYAADGSAGADCKSTGGSSDCYWCAK